MSISPPSILWHNGVLLAESEVRISPFDHGLTVGDGVFETLIAYDGEIFARTRHWERLARSAQVLGLLAPSHETLDAACLETMGANGLARSPSPVRLRVTLTGGAGPLGSDRGQEGATLLVAAVPAPSYAGPAHIVTVPWTRNERGALSGAKTTSYGENVVALAYAKERGGSEAIFANTRGDLCEGTGSNIFAVHSGILHTPGLDAGPLAGVTRALVLEIAEAEGVRIDLTARPLDSLFQAEEVFLTSTTREVQPVSRINDTAFPADGKITARLSAAFQELKKRNPNP